MTTLVMSGKSCGRTQYNRMYEQAKFTLWDTNVVCQSIQTANTIIDYYCGDEILKTGLNGFPAQDTCTSSEQRSLIFQLRVNLERLNTIICNEIVSSNLTIMPANTTDIFCRIHSANGVEQFHLSFFIGITSLFVSFMVV
jgi:hypothetical protein